MGREAGVWRHVRFGAYGLYSVAVVFCLFFFVGAASPSKGLVQNPPCDDPVSCLYYDSNVVNGYDAVDVYSQSQMQEFGQYMYSLYTDPADAYTATSPSGGSFMGLLDDYGWDDGSVSGAESLLSSGSFDLATDTTLTASAFAEASTGVLLPVAVGTSAYVVYKLIFGSSTVGYEQLPLTLLSNGLAVDTGDVGVSAASVGWEYDAGTGDGNAGCEASDSVCQSNFDLVQEYHLSTPTFANDWYYSGLGPNFNQPFTCVGDELVCGLADPGVYVNNGFLGLSGDCPAVTDWTGDSTSVSEVQACSDLSFVPGLVQYNLANAIQTTFVDFPADTVIPVYQENLGDASLEYIQPGDMLGLLGTPTAADPGGEVSSVDLSLPSPVAFGSAGASWFTEPMYQAVTSDPCLVAALDALMDSSYPAGGCVSSGTYPSATYAPSLVFLPAPAANQTCDEYVTALATLGYTGDASCVTLPDAQAVPNVGPHGVATVSWTPPGSSAITVSAVSWPVTSPSIQPGQSLTIQQNPLGVPTVPGSSGGNGSPPGGVVAGGGFGAPGCSCPPISLGPLSGLSLGDKFPFGMFSWLASYLAPYNQEWESGQAPTVDIGVPLTSDSVPVDFNNSTWDTVHAYYFTVVEVLMTIAALVFLVVRVIGVGGSDG